jgi:hypothetical protein
VKVQTEMLALGRHGKSGHSRNLVMHALISEVRRVSCWHSGEAAREQEQNVTLIQEGEVGLQSSGFFIAGHW